MCGIAGVYSFKTDTPPVKEAVSEMTNAIAHRGPDGEGTWMDESNRVILGHRRLSIIDLSVQAAQPMLSADAGFVITYNGEIYNYKELKADLMRQGLHFSTQSDTEVLLQLYTRDGVKCLELLDGMFAFAIWNNATKTLFCARDRFGEKPFYFYADDQQFVFASEIKAIKAYRGSLDFNTSLLQKYLEGAVRFEDTQTCFNGIQALAPASYMLVSPEGIRIEKYWEIDLQKKTVLENDEAYIQRFHELFLESVSKRLRSDVPVGSSLSGGLDSSVVAGTMSETGNLNFHTFSARFRSEKDEGKWIADVVEKAEIQNHQVWPDEEGLLNDFDKITWHQEYPLGSASVYAQWSVMNLPRAYGVKVLLDGQGADEYLCGYDELKYYAIWDLWHQGHFADFFRERKCFRQYFGAHGKLGWAFMTDPFLRVFGLQRAVYKNGYTLKEQLLYFTSTRLGELLRYADRNSMAHSIEVRLPFLSHKLVEYVFSIPDNLIYRNGKTKYILREAMRKALPASVYNRTDKIGFAPPQKDWMKLPSFLAEASKADEVLKSAGLIPGSDLFKNIAVASLIRVFRT